MNNLKYILYARKSSESEDRQVQSIDDQVSGLKKLAADAGYKVVATLTESKSAKEPGSRPVFREMLDRISNGQADGILCWQINRLSRNPVDSGEIQWLLQRHTIKSIQTIEREYRPEDNTLLFSVESGMANQFLLDLSKGVKRGIQGKLERGWMPGVPPPGYLNDKEDKTIIADPERFDLIRKMMDLMLTGVYTVPKIRDIANQQWGFRTRKSKRMGGNEISMSGIYNIFINPFYAGLIKHKGELYPGKHKPMITLEEFDRIQDILGRKGKPRPYRHSFAYTGMITCGECGSSITAEEKVKTNKTDGKVKTYRFYHCTRRRQGTNCTQRKFIREEVLEKALADQLTHYEILPEFRDWALDVLRSQHGQEVQERSDIQDSLVRALKDNQRQLDNLTQMRIRDLLSDEEYIQQKEALLSTQRELRQSHDRAEQRADHWLELTEKVFNFAANAREAFQSGDLMTKREILASLGQNFQLKDGILTLEAHPWLQPIKNGYPKLEKQYLRLELNEVGSDKEKTPALAGIISDWQGWKESNPRSGFWRPMSYH